MKEPATQDRPSEPKPGQERDRKPAPKGGERNGRQNGKGKQDPNEAPNQDQLAG